MSGTSIPDEIFEEFKNETLGLVGQMETILGELEDDIKQSKKFEDFGQLIDRIMGAAKALELTDIASMSELGKTIGYKAAQVKDLNLQTLVVPILFDCIDLIKKMVQVKSGDSLSNISTKAFITRLKWLAEKFAHIRRASVKIDTSKKTDKATDDDDDEDLDDLIKMFDDEDDE